MPRKAIPKRSIKELIAALRDADRLSEPDVEALNALAACIKTLRALPWSEAASRYALPFDARHALAAGLQSNLQAILTRSVPAQGTSAAAKVSAAYRRRIADLRASLEAFLRNADTARNPQGVAIDSAKRRKVLTPLQTAVYVAYDALKEAEAPTHGQHCLALDMAGLQTTFTERCENWIEHEGIEGPPNEGLSKMRIVKEWIEACKALTRDVMDAKEQQ